MKKVIGYILAGLTGFAAGSFAGWMARKKTTEVAFEEISEEEQAKMIAGDGEKEPVSRPADIQAAINRTFGLPDNYTGPENSFTTEEGNGLVQLDTRKTQYMKQWKAEEAAEKYDTRTKEVPKHVVATDEDDDLEAGFDPDFLRKAQRTAGDIEEATMDDWDHWLGIPDGDYDCVEVWWYEQDNVLTDEHGDELENAESYIGFSVPQKFEEISEETTGDPDIRVVYNHREGAIFQIIRKHGSYDRKKSMEEFGDDGEDDDSEEWIRSRNE